MTGPRDIPEVGRGSSYGYVVQAIVGLLIGSALVTEALPRPGWTAVETWALYLVLCGVALIGGVILGHVYTQERADRKALGLANFNNEVAHAQMMVDGFSGLMREGHHLFPESLLPADKETIKNAFRVAVIAHVAAGRIDSPAGQATLRDAYVTGYAHLALTAPDDVAERINRFYGFMRDLASVRDVIDQEKLAAAIVKRGISDEDRAEETRCLQQMADLTAEFRAFIEKTRTAFGG